VLERAGSLHFTLTSFDRVRTKPGGCTNQPVTDPNSITPS
jgi:hypothetical protein